MAAAGAGAGDEFGSCAYSAAELHAMMSCTDSAVDLERLREAARFGIPAPVRGRVWRYLLGVSRPDHADELAAAQRRRAELSRLQQELGRKRRAVLAPDTLRQLRAEIRRYSHAALRTRSVSPGKAVDAAAAASGGSAVDAAAASADSSVAAAAAPADVGDSVSVGSDADSDEVEKMVMLYLANHRSVEYEPSLLYLLAPFRAVLSEPSDVYFCFATLREYMDAIDAQAIELWLAKFVMLFRTFDSNLCTHFEDEEVRPTEWALPWLRHLLCKELPLPCVLRLWDTYLAESADVELHIFVCLAILGRCKEALLECEYSELKALLRHLPDMDMDQILAQARNLQNQVSIAWETAE